MSSNYDSELAFAKKLALAANKISDKYYKSELAFKTKSDTTPVTVADETINSLVIAEVQKAYPDYGVLGEEESWHADKASLWVCDPIDGTVAFSMGEPIFTFSLALVVDGKPVLAVVRELAMGRTYWATIGGGAYRDDEPIHISKRSLAQAWLAYPGDPKRLYAFRAVYEPLAQAAYQVNSIQGGVFKGMLVAQGLADGFIYPGPVHPWDYAAVKIIVEEAGGQVTNSRGLDQLYDRELDSIVISNGVIHQDLLTFMQPKK